MEVEVEVREGDRKITHRLHGHLRVTQELNFQQLPKKNEPPLSRNTWGPNTSPPPYASQERPFSWVRGAKGAVNAKD